jgi:hypothetical protein
MASVGEQLAFGSPRICPVARDAGCSNPLVVDAADRWGPGPGERPISISATLVFFVHDVNIDMSYNFIRRPFADTSAMKELNVLSRPTAPRNQFALVGVIFMTWGTVFPDRTAQLYLTP